MRPIGITRHVDDLGRVVIPKELRKSLNINEGDAMEITAKGKEVILIKYETKQCDCGQVVDDSDTYCRNCGKEL